MANINKKIPIKKFLLTLLQCLTSTGFRTIFRTLRGELRLSCSKLLNFMAMSVMAVIVGGVAAMKAVITLTTAVKLGSVLVAIV